jgi:hypothetical protein
MADNASNSRPVGALGRPVYEENGLLSSCDLGVEQGYLLQRLRRHLRHLHNWGVVCGLGVVAANDHLRPWGVIVCPGYAIGPYGDEITVPGPASLDIRDYIWAQPATGAAPPRIAFVGIAYAERSTLPDRANPAPCGCEDGKREHSRIRDAFDLDILWSLPAPPSQDRFDVCSGASPVCPACPESRYVVLARVRLPASEGDPILDADIDQI